MEKRPGGGEKRSGDPVIWTSGNRKARTSHQKGIARIAKIAGITKIENPQKAQNLTTDQHG
jgi:hypothetical protein